jgi:hypothetical protein
MYLSNQFKDRVVREKIDPLKVGPSLLLYSITDFVIRKKRGTNKWLEILLKLSKLDKLVHFYVASLLMSQDRLKECMTNLARTI